MSAATRTAEISAIDRFLSEPKTLTESLPSWKDLDIPGRWAAAWPILDEDGVAVEGTRLVFSCKKEDTSRASIRVLLRDTQVFGIDLVRPGECKSNPPDAHRIEGLASRVCGSHFHAWPDNRDHALRVGPGSLPYRRLTPRLLVRLPHALAAMAQEINLTLTPAQASFDVPPQGYLLTGGDNDL